MAGTAFFILSRTLIGRHGADSRLATAIGPGVERLGLG